MSLKTRSFQFGDYLLDAQEKVLFCGGKPVSITPKAFLLLQTLVEKQGHLVEKEQLMQAVWADSFVEQGNLSFTINLLRKVLGDDSREPRFIETVPRRGYRFVAEVSTVNFNSDGPWPNPEPRSKFTDSRFGGGEGKFSTNQGGNLASLAAWQRDTAPARASAPLDSQDVDDQLEPISSIVPPLERRRFSNTLVIVVILVLGLIGAGYGINRFLSSAQRSDQGPPAVTRLTSDGNARSAAVSSDGKFIAYVLDENGSQSLRLKNIVNESDIEIVAAAESVTLGSIVFAPDGNYVYYGTRGGLYQVAILGGQPKRIIEAYGAASHNEISFSPDGRRFAFVRYLSEEVKETAVIVVADVNGTNERILSTSERPLLFTGSAAWSPDGRVIACGARKDNVSEVAFVNVADGSIASVSNARWRSFGQVTWRPDGKSLFVVASAQASLISRIWSLSYPGNEVEKFTQDANNYQSVSVTADGRSIIAARSEQDAHIWLMPNDDMTRARQLTTGFEKYDGVFSIGWRSDNDIVYEALPDDSGEVWSLDLDRGTSKELVDGVHSPAMSPDAKYLVFIAENSDRGLFRMNNATGERKRLTDGDDSDPAFSPDGTWVVFTRYAEQVAIWKVPIHGGEVVRLTFCTGYPSQPTVSPDGKLVAFYRGKSGSQTHAPLAIVAIEGGEIFKDFGASFGSFAGYRKFGVQWSPDGKSINYAAIANGVSNIWRQPIDGGDPVKVTNFDSGLIFNFAYSPSAKNLAISKGTYTRDIVLLRTTK